MNLMHYVRAFCGIVWRELLRFLQQRERFFAALVRPLIWLIIFAAGFRAALGISIIPPYQTYITYDVYITPGLLAMIQLFQGMQSSLSMVYDREMGSMRVLLTTPLPRWFLLVARLFGGVIVSLFQVYTFLLVAYFCGVELPHWGYLAALPALILTGLMFGALGMSCAVPLTKATSTFLSWAITLASPQTFLSKSPRSMGCRLSRAAPAPCRAMNRRSLTSTERCFACSTMRSIDCL